MKTRKYALIFLSSLMLVSCSVVEDLEDKSYYDQTLDLLAGTKWKVDSLRQWKFLPATGVKDSIFLNYGTMEFQMPKTDPLGNNGGIPQGYGYMIHSYTKNGKARIDTLAWLPAGVGSRKPDPKPIYDLAIWYEDPNGQPYSFSDDLDFGFNFRIREKNEVNLYGEFKRVQPGLTIAEFHYSYHLTK